MKDYFRKFSLCIEKYAVEVFFLEFLIVFILSPSIRMGALLAFGVLFTTGVSESLKLLFKERRPHAAMERAFYRRGFSINKRSFPSTHASISMFFVGFLSNGLLAAPFLVFALAVIYSRLYIKSHYPRDVAAGALIGFLIGYALLYLFV